MVYITMLRGLKVPLHILDAFLAANGIPEEHGRLCAGSPPRYKNDSDKVTTLLRQKTGEHTKTRIFMPYKQSMDLSSNAYIAYDWFSVYVQRKVKSDEPSQTPPAGFEALRKDILSYGNGELIDEDFQTDLYIVVTDEQSYVAPELAERHKVCNLLTVHGMARSEIYTIPD